MGDRTRTGFTVFFSGVVALTLFTFLNEYLSASQFLSVVNSGEKGLPSTSATYQKAANDWQFTNSESVGAKKRLNKIIHELVTVTGLLLISTLFLSPLLRKHTKRVAGRHITVVKAETFNVNLIEINFLTIFASLIGLLYFRSSLLRLIEKSATNFVIFVLCLFIGFFVLVPLLNMISIKMLRIYSIRLIIACYLAYFIKAGTEFFNQSEADLQTMERISISEFSQTVQDFLTERGIEERVYRERSPSNSINAALVGWGSKERIEIYGRHQNFSDREFDSVILHELGHSANYSLICKIVVLFAIKFAEMLILLFLYLRISKAYTDDDISVHMAFLALALIYFTVVERWVLVGHKITSQMAEKGADVIAKRMDYGEALGNVLYKICVTGKEYMRGTPLYNALISYHPTVYDRIEYLTA